MKPRPNLFIVGAPKCGTTAMYTYLNKHPDIFMSPKKELNHFCEDLDIQWSVRDPDAYLAYFQGSGNHRWRGEASVWYLYSRVAARKIKDFNPESKIIIMLRHPVDMIYANYYQFLYNGNENILDFEEALHAQEVRKTGNRIPPGAHFPEGLQYYATAMYSEQVKRYMDQFPPEQIHIIFYEDLKSNPGKVYRDVLTFLGLEPLVEPDFKPVNASRQFRLKHLGAWLNNPPPVIKTITAVIPKRFRRKITRRLKRVNLKSEQRPRMDPQLRSRLIGVFSEDILRLSQLTGRDLNAWLQ